MHAWMRVQAIDKSTFSILNADWNKLKENLKETDLPNFRTLQVKNLHYIMDCWSMQKHTTSLIKEMPMVELHTKDTKN